MKGDASQFTLFDFWIETGTNFLNVVYVSVLFGTHDKKLLILYTLSVNGIL